MDTAWLRAHVFNIFFVFFLLTWVIPVPAAVIGGALILFGALVMYITLQPGLRTDDYAQMAYLLFSVLSIAAGGLRILEEPAAHTLQIAAFVVIFAAFILSSRR